MREKYKNISCGLYDEYIRFIELKHELLFEQKVVLMTDIFTKEKQEFARLSQGTVLRLDEFIIENGAIILKKE